MEKIASGPEPMPEDEAREFAKRRQVLKGIVGVPVVATLGGGFSAASASILNCADTGGVAPEPPAEAHRNYEI